MDPLNLMRHFSLISHLSELNFEIETFGDRWLIDHSRYWKAFCQSFFKAWRIYLIRVKSQTLVIRSLTNDGKSIKLRVLERKVEENFKASLILKWVPSSRLFCAKNHQANLEQKTIELIFKSILMFLPLWLSWTRVGEKIIVWTRGFVSLFWSFQSHVVFSHIFTHSPSLCSIVFLAEEKENAKEKEFISENKNEAYTKRRDTNKYPDEENKCSRWKYPLAASSPRLFLQSSKTKNYFWDTPNMLTISL